MKFSSRYFFLFSFLMCLHVSYSYCLPEVRAIQKLKCLGCVWFSFSIHLQFSILKNNENMFPLSSFMCYFLKARSPSVKCICDCEMSWLFAVISGVESAMFIEFGSVINRWRWRWSPYVQFLHFGFLQRQVEFGSKKIIIKWIFYLKENLE